MNSEISPETIAKPRPQQILPGFGLTMGYTITYLSLLVLIPLAAAFVSAFKLPLGQWLHVLLAPRVLAAFRLSITASFVAALINSVFGLLIAWVLVRYVFRGGACSMRWSTCLSHCPRQWRALH